MGSKSGNSYYQKVNGNTWSLAEAAAVALGGHLVEAGFDMFQINSSASTNIKDNSFLGNKKLLKIVDLLGREVIDLKNTQLFYIYDDGTVDHKMIID